LQAPQAGAQERPHQGAQQQALPQQQPRDLRDVLNGNMAAEDARLVIE